MEQNEVWSKVKHGGEEQSAGWPREVTKAEDGSGFALQYQSARCVLMLCDGFGWYGVVYCSVLCCDGPGRCAVLCLWCVVADVPRCDSLIRMWASCAAGWHPPQPLAGAACDAGAVQG
eukprot:scaffold196122_cov17-Tisochrysis_lutea.AAC.2